MLREEALVLVRRLTEAAAQQDIQGLTAFYAHDAVVVSPIFGEVRGRDAIAATWGSLFSTLSDVSIEISDLLVDGSRIAVLSSIRAIAATGWFGSAAGGAVEYRLVLLLTIAAGQILRDERIYDSAAVLERLEKARLESELRTAAEVQRALMGWRGSIARVRRG